MKYLVSEVQQKTLSASGEAKVFNTISDAVKHIQTINKNKRLSIGEREVTLDLLEELLKERLSIVSLFAEREEEKKWVISAF